MGTKVRILVATYIGGVLYKPNQVVDLPASIAKPLHADGQVDPDKAAVAYCVNELGAEVIVYKAAPTLEQLQLQVEIDSLQAKLAEAPDADKPALQAALDEKIAALG